MHNNRTRTKYMHNNLLYLKFEGIKIFMHYKKSIIQLPNFSQLERKICSCNAESDRWLRIGTVASASTLNLIRRHSVACQRQISQRTRCSCQRQHSHKVLCCLIATAWLQNTLLLSGQRVATTFLQLSHIEQSTGIWLQNFAPNCWSPISSKHDLWLILWHIQQQIYCCQS